MKRLLIVYIPYDFSDKSRGSSVRPYFLTRALMKEFSGKVFVITGDAKKRKAEFKRVKSIASRYRKEDVGVYMESKNWHLSVTDYYFIFWARLKKIRSSIFVRDIYIFFQTEYPAKNIKEKLIFLWMSLDYILYVHLFNIVFTPNKYFSAKMPWVKRRKLVSLPPAGKEVRYEKKRGKNLNILYVGGVAKNTGEDLLIKGFEEAKKKNSRYKLTIVCNEESEYLKSVQTPDVTILTNKSRDDITHIFMDADIAIVPRKNTTYHDIAMPIKLFDYLSYGLPVIVTNNKALAEFVKKEGVGIVVNDSATDLADAILDISDVAKLDNLRSKCYDSLKSNNWRLRARKIEKVIFENK